MIRNLSIRLLVLHTCWISQASRELYRAYARYLPKHFFLLEQRKATASPGLDGGAKFLKGSSRTTLDIQMYSVSISMKVSNAETR